MRIDLSLLVAAAVTLVGAIVLVWALTQRRRIDVTERVRVMVMPQLPHLDGAPQPHARFAKGSVEFASVDASVADVERPQSLRPSHARRTSP